MVGSQTRVLDSIVLGEESSPGTEASTYDVTLLGDIINCTLKTPEENKVLGGIQGGSTAGHLPSKIVNLKVTPQGTVTFHPHTLKFYKYVISDLVDGAGSYSLNNNDTSLPTSLSIKGNYNNTDGVRYLGCYLTNVRFALVDNNICSITADIVALYSETINEVVTYTAPSGSPLTYADGTFTFGGNEWDLDTINVTYNPKFTQKWGINTKSTGRKRYPSAIYRGGKADIPFDGVANVESIADELEAAQGGSSVADKKSNSALVLNFVDDDGETHIINMLGQINEPEITQTDAEETSKQIRFSGNCTDFSVSGTQ